MIFKQYDYLDDLCKNIDSVNQSVNNVYGLKKDPPPAVSIQPPPMQKNFPQRPQPPPGIQPPMRNAPPMSMPPMPSMQPIPGMPGVPNMPNMPSMSNMPNMQSMPNMFPPSMHPMVTNISRLFN